MNKERAELTEKKGWGREASQQLRDTLSREIYPNAAHNWCPEDHITKEQQKLVFGRDMKQTEEFLVYAKTTKQTVWRFVTEYCKIRLKRSAWRGLPSFLWAAGWTGVEMDYLATLAMMESNRELCPRRRQRPDEQDVLLTFRGECESVHNVLYSMIERVITKPG